MDKQGAFSTGEYPNVFKQFHISEQEIQAKVERTWNDLFYGDDDTRIYYPSGSDTGYMYDTGNCDARTEGMSYGMMMAVQMNKKEEFDRIWKWTKTNMYMDSGLNSGYFAWSVRPDGVKLSDGPAPDGEEYFAMALFFASHRWGDGEPPFDYSTQAKAILHTCLHKGEDSVGFPMWNPDNKLIQFVPGSSFTDPSYHLPHFYDLFSIWSDEADRSFWKQAANASRDFLKKACHPITGLAAEYSEYDGTPHYDEGHGYFYSDAYRVAENVALDSVWFGASDWHCAEESAIQAFFVKNGLQLEDFKIYEIDGRITGEKALHPYGLLSTIAMASLCSKDSNAEKIAQIFWNLPLRTGKRRYYDNCLYFFSLLALSGNYRIW